jgi:hypothetical protein
MPFDLAGHQPLDADAERRHRLLPVKTVPHPLFEVGVRRLEAWRNS